MSQTSSRARAAGRGTSRRTTPLRRLALIAGLTASLTFGLTSLAPAYSAKTAI